MNQQNNRNTCSCGTDSRSGSCSYGRTPWGTREGCSCNRSTWGTREGCSCGRRPWNTRSTNCNTCNGTARNTSGCNNACPSAANTTWRNRGENCPCAAARTGTCPATTSARSGCGCAEARETRSTCSCGDARRDTDCDADCNPGAANNGILDGRSLAMVYSPYQNFEELYDPRQGLCTGTIFGGLDKPFCGDGRGL